MFCKDFSTTVCLHSAFSAYKRLEEQQTSEDWGRRLWKVDASDTGDDSDGLD